MDAKISSYFNENKKLKKAQVTIFIILGLIIIIGFLIVFLLIYPPEITIIDEDNPQAYIESCTKNAVDDALEILTKQGGDIDPKGHITYNSEKISYLCFNTNYFEPCINQRPLLVEHIENEINDYIRPVIAECFNEIETELKKTNDIKTSDMSLKTRLTSRNIAVDIEKKFEIEKGENVRDFKDFRVVIANPIYDLADIAMEIVNQESRFCNFDELGFMILHPEYDITKFITGETNIIYTVKERSTGQKFVFVVRSCKLPPGF